MRRTRHAAIAIALIGVVAAVGTAVVGFVLANIYRPHAPGASAIDMSPPARRSDRWTDWHRAASAVLVVSAAVSLAHVVALMVGLKDVMQRKALVMGAAIVAVVMGILTVLTRSLVEWNQLALWSVTVGSDIDGYWAAAFRDDIRFVLVGYNEVSQGEYRAAFLAHLAAPVIGALALLLLSVAVGRPRQRRDIGEAPPDTSSSLAASTSSAGLPSISQRQSSA